MRAEGRILHPTKDRFVTIRELARAQTFPDSFVLDPKRVYALKQVSVLLSLILHWRPKHASRTKQIDNKHLYADC